MFRNFKNIIVQRIIAADRTYGITVALKGRPQCTVTKAHNDYWTINLFRHGFGTSIGSSCEEVMEPFIKLLKQGDEKIGVAQPNELFSAHDSIHPRRLITVSIIIIIAIRLSHGLMTSVLVYVTCPLW